MLLQHIDDNYPYFMNEGQIVKRRHVKVSKDISDVSENFKELNFSDTSLITCYDSNTCTCLSSI